MAVRWVCAGSGRLSVTTCRGDVGRPAVASQFETTDRIRLVGKRSHAGEADRLASSACSCVLRASHGANGHRSAASDDLVTRTILTGLSTDEFAAILSHELAHIRRYDLWMNLLQRLIESLLFFHPAVWMLSRRVSTEREVCCDDLAVRGGAVANELRRSLIAYGGAVCAGSATATRVTLRRRSHVERA